VGYEPTEYYDERPERDHAMLQELISTLQVWNKLLFPLWSTESSRVKEIDFSKDDGEAILILLNIAHLQSRLVPKGIGLQDPVQNRNSLRAVRLSRCRRTLEIYMASASK